MKAANMMDALICSIRQIDETVMPLLSGLQLGKN